MGISPSHTHTLPIKSALTVQIIAHIMFKRHEWTLGLDVSLGEFIREFIGLGVRFLLFANIFFFFSVFSVSVFFTLWIHFIQFIQCCSMSPFAQGGCDLRDTIIVHVSKVTIDLKCLEL